MQHEALVGSFTTFTFGSAFRHAPPGPVLVDYWTTDGSYSTNDTPAVTAIDYVETHGVLTWVANDTMLYRKIDLRALGTASVDPTKIFTLNFHVQSAAPQQTHSYGLILEGQP